MSNFEFSGPKLYPTIRVESQRSCLRSTEQLLEAGVNGVFLQISGNEVDDIKSALDIASETSVRFPNNVGINFLDLHKLQEVLTFIRKAEIAPTALWCQYYQELENLFVQSEEQAIEFGDTLDEIELFMGITGKGDSDSIINDPWFCSERALEVGIYADYITINGLSNVVPRNDFMPPLNVQIVDATKSSMSIYSRTKVAIAAGINAANISDYIGLVDAVIVTEDQFDALPGEIDLNRLSLFMSAFRYSIVQERERRDQLACDNNQVEPNPIDQLHLDFGFNAGW